MNGGRTVVLGIGNLDRGDDAAGRLAIRAFARRRAETRANAARHVEILEHDGDPATLLAILDGAATAVIVDAAASGTPAGTVRRFDAGAAPLPARQFGLSTHGFGLAEGLELARALGQLPGRCIVYAVEGASFDAGSELTAAVAAAVESVAVRIGAELDDQEAGSS